MNDLRNLSLLELEELLQAKGEKRFRAHQIFEWIHKKHIKSLHEAKNLNKRCVDILSQEYELYNMSIEKVLVSKDGTRKFLMRLFDGAAIECVLMHYRGDKAKKRNTLCVSTQVGCAMACSFCATGTMGLKRNLSVSEILQQIYHVDDLLLAEDDLPVGNIVFMGMGEPFHNREAVKKAIEILLHPKGKGMGSRRITVSTCGVVPGIYDFASWPGEIGLAISLHATEDAKRSTLMPVNNSWPIQELLDACRAYQDATDRRITFEYALIYEVNDDLEQAKALVELLQDMKAHVNLIPINNTLHSSLKVPSKNRIRAFKDFLNHHGLSASIREEKGQDIQGACGQLAIKT